MNAVSDWFRSILVEHKGLPAQHKTRWLFREDPDGWRCSFVYLPFMACLQIESLFCPIRHDVMWRWWWKDNEIMFCCPTGRCKKPITQGKHILLSHVLPSVCMKAVGPRDPPAMGVEKRELTFFAPHHHHHRWPSWLWEPIKVKIRPHAEGWKCAINLLIEWRLLLWYIINILELIWWAVECAHGEAVTWVWCLTVIWQNYEWIIRAGIVWKIADASVFNIRWMIFTFQAVWGDEF